MTDIDAKDSTPSSSRALARRVVVFAAVMMLVGFLLSAFSYWMDGSPGLEACLLAFGVCVGSGLLAMLASFGLGRILSEDVRALGEMVAGMMTRMFLPLIACLVIYLQKLPVIEDGFVWYLMAFYLLALGLETLFAVRDLAQADRVETGSLEV